MLSYINRSLKKYSQTHEWLDIEGLKGNLGISSYHALHLGDIAAAFILEIKDYKKGEEIGYIESAKSVVPLVAPINLKILEINPEIETNPSILNKSPERKGWIAKIEIENENDMNSLFEREDYLNFLEKSEEKHE